MTSSSSMELDLSERERVAELARLDKVFIHIFKQQVWSICPHNQDVKDSGILHKNLLCTKIDIFQKEHLEQVDAMLNFVDLRHLSSGLYRVVFFTVPP